LGDVVNIIVVLPEPPAKPTNVLLAGTDNA
jgi:hypothetical protein